MVFWDYVTRLEEETRRLVRCYCSKEMNEEFPACTDKDCNDLIRLNQELRKLNGFVFWLCGNWRGTEDSCRVWSFLDRDTEVYAVLTKLKENLSASATNAAESRCEQLCEAEKSPPQAKPIEHDTRSVSWT